MIKKYKNTKDTDKDHRIEIADHHIYFYSDITDDTVVELIQLINELERDMLDVHFRTQMPLQYLPIHLHISSEGGDVYAGFNAYHYIVNCKVPVYTYVEGFVASAGTFLSVAGKKRYMQKYATMMVHQVSFSTSQSMTYEKVKDEKVALDMIMNSIQEIYTKHTKIKKKPLTELLKRDAFMDANMALTNNFVDIIL